MADGDRNSGWGGDGGRWVPIILFALFGRGGDRGFGNGGHGTGDGTFDGGIPNGFALATDFASLERKTDGVDNGPCDGFYATANGMDTGFAAVQNALCRGFNGVAQAVTSQGCESRLGTQALQARLAQCRLGTQAAIQANTAQGAMNANAIRRQVASCRCGNERQQMQPRFENRQNRCAAMQAIDKVGGRIVDYLTNREARRLRDGNQSLEFQASQVAQNRYLTDTPRPCPSPAYITCKPWAGRPHGSCAGYGRGCGRN